MKVVLRHENTWLLIKDVYAIRRQRRRRGRQRGAVTPYGTVAVSVDEPPLDGMKYFVELEVPATKVMRFIVKMFQAQGDAVVTVEPAGYDAYKVKIHARTKRAAEQAGETARRILAQLRSRREHEEEAEEAEEAMEEEEE